MSGFVTGFGNTDMKKISYMFEKIRHRGPWLSGIWEDHHGSIMAQNYLRADTRAADENSSVHSMDREGSLSRYNELPSTPAEGRAREDGQTNQGNLKKKHTQ